MKSEQRYVIGKKQPIPNYKESRHKTIAENRITSKCIKLLQKQLLIADNHTYWHLITYPILYFTHSFLILISKTELTFKKYNSILFFSTLSQETSNKKCLSTFLLSHSNSHSQNVQTTIGPLRSMQSRQAKSLFNKSLVFCY